MRAGTPLVALLALVALSAFAAEPTGLRMAQNDKAVTVKGAAGRPVLEYRFAEVPYKPYVKLLTSPSGVNVLRDAPSDHLHHHALMFALGVDDVDFWIEAADQKPGRQVHRAIEEFAGLSSSPVDGAATARFSERLDWLAPDDKLMLSEHRAIMLETSGDLGATLLTWRSRLECPPGRESVRLTGRHYFGLGVRFVESMDRGGRRFSADEATGPTIRGDEQVIPARWMAYTARAGDKPVTVAVFDHPSNPRHPAGIFSMTQPFAYLSATLNLHKEPLVLAAGKPLELCYGVAVWDGEAKPAEIDRLWQTWRERAK